MRESTRTEVRDIAEAVVSRIVVRYADALARSPYALRTMETTARNVAASVARAVADEHVANADEIVRAAELAAGESANDTARRVAENTAAELAEATASQALRSARAAAEEVLARAQHELRAVLGAARTEQEETLGKLRREFDNMCADVAQFAHDEVARVVAATVVQPVVEVTVASADPVRLTGHTHAVLPEVLLALGAGCHLLLVGPAGTGKSMMARQAAEALGQEFHALSLGPTTPMSKIFGYYDAHGHYHGTPFRRAFEHGGLMLLDELDSGHPGLLAELNQALSIRSCAFADGMVSAHPAFRLIATANTYGTGGDRQYVGRQALDAATLDRYVFIDVPVDEGLEERVALAHAPSRPEEARYVIEEVRRLRAVAAEKRLPVMFSPRACIDAAKLLQAGASVEQAVQWRVVRGLSAAHRSALDLDVRRSSGEGQA
ncbi:hypothetical protein B4N89_41435 [Embleya scabrispora]|uniref:AAA+ ATPase domain-containing protein n=1 Tax=Embleya scabrispora TaxID=159449 RepID=A0A1T3NK84_9ACTN|nr:AAA family ATPase [Embleya scabrispora]OPC77041.1 hypothetical protein B4N89_41435 [Embleya scabrispora]